MKTSISKISLIVYFVFLSISIVWVAMIFLAPYLYSLGGSNAKLGSYIYMFYSETCHQIDSRSFAIFGYKLAVCSRCSVIYISFLLSVILYPFIWKLDEQKMPSIWVLIIPSFLLAADALLDFANIISNSFLSRSITGFLIGFILPLFLIPGLISLFKGFNKTFNK